MMNVNDVVRIKNDLVVDEVRAPYVTDFMLAYRGRVGRVTYVNTGRTDGLVTYRLDIDNNAWSWADWMFETNTVNSTDSSNETDTDDTDDTEVMVCSDCDAVIGEDDESYITVDGNVICQDCYENDYFRCPCCDEIHNIDYGYTTPSDELYCEGCFNDYCTYCDDCGTVMWSDDAYYNDDDGCYYCEDCYHENCSGVMSYHEFNAWYKHTTGNESKYSNVSMGTEIEVERCGGTSHKQMVGIVKDVLDDLVVFEHDGSLDDGFEMISHPMTYDYWMSVNDKFDKALALYRENGYKSHDTDTCGLHIHVGRDCLATSNRTEEDVIDNIILIMETFKAELTAFSRRSSNKIERWAHFLTSECDDVTLSYVKDKKTTGDRYVALNLRNRKTIEFRIFKGTLVKETLYAALELVKNIVNIAKFDKLDGLTWNDIICYHKSVNKYLMQYNQTRNIVSTNAIHVFSKYETNMKDYSLENFKKGKFIIDCRNYETNYAYALADMLYLNGIDVSSDGCTIKTTATRNRWGLGSELIMVENGNLKMLYHIDDMRDLERVHIKIIVDLWFEHLDLLQCA